MIKYSALSENIKEGINAIRVNVLRTVLTVIIIAIGITALVGILTAVDGIRASISESFSSLGANNFDISAKDINRWGRSRGVAEKAQPPIKYQQAVEFKRLFQYGGEVTIFTDVTGSAEVRRLSKTTNPNMNVRGGDENYLSIRGYSLEYGRNFSANESRNGSDVAIIGHELKSVLFDEENSIDANISFLGRTYRVVGVLEEQGAIGSGGVDRSIIVPLENARKLGTSRQMRFEITVSLKDPAKITYAMGEATGLMRFIRQDKLGEDESFEISRSVSLTERLSTMTGYLQAGGMGVGLITLIGASIALMNIMMVSVTERTREIGIRKALGATPSKIMQQFLVEAIVICQIGGIFGIILGILIGNVVSNILGAGAFVVPWIWIVVGFLLGLIVGILSGYYPARKASRLDPIESLHFE